MTMQQFIRENRSELDAAIKNAIGHVPRTASCYCPKSGTDHYHEPDALNDKERRLWILNALGSKHIFVGFGMARGSVSARKIRSCISMQKR